MAFAGTGSGNRFALILRISTVEAAGSIFAVSRSTLTGFMCGGLLVQLQKAVGEVLRAADAQRGGDGLDGGFRLADDLALAHLGQLGDHQVIAADVTPGAVLALVGAVDAGVGIAGHIAVGGQLRGLEIDLIAALTGAVGAGGSNLHNVGADDGITLFFREAGGRLVAASCLQVGIDGLIFRTDPVPIIVKATLIQLDVSVLLDGIIGDSAGQLVVGALVGAVVGVAAVILVVAVALAALVIPADLAVQADRLVALTVDQVSGIVVPLQLQILAHQHTVGLIDLIVLVRQQIQLGAGSKIEVADVVALLFVVHSVTMNTNFLAVSVCIVIIAAPPSRFPIDLNFGTIRCLAEGFEFIRLFTGVVVLLGLFVIRTLVGNVSGALGDPLLLLQSLDQLILAHIFGRDGRGEILDDVRLLGLVRNLQIADPEFLAGQKFALDLLNLLPQLVVCLLKILIVLDDVGDTGGGVHILPDGEGLAQGAVIHGDGFVTLREGRGLAVGVQSDAVSGNTVLACQRGLNLFRGQRSTGLFGEGVGGLYAVFVLDRAGVAVIGFGHLVVGLSVHRNGASLFVDRPVLAAGDHQLVVKILGVRLCGFGKFIDRPFHALDAGEVHAADIDVITCSFQLIFVLIFGVLVQQLRPGDLFLLRIAEGSGRFRDRAGTGDLGDGAVGRGHGVFLFVDRGALLRVVGVDCPTIERGKFTAVGLDVGAVEGTAFGPCIRAVHISGAGDDVVRNILTGLGVLARIGSARLRRRNRCPIIAEGDSMNIAVCIGIAEIELAFAGGIDRIQLVLEIIGLHINAGVPGGIRQSGLDGFQLGSFLGTLDAFRTAFDLAGGLGDLGDLHGVAQSLAHGFHLVKVQLFALVVNAVVIAGEALAQTFGQLRVGERLGVFRFLDFIGIFLAVHVFRIDILAGNVVIVLVLEHFAQLLRRNLDDIRLGLVGVLGSDAWQFDLGGQILIININGALFHLEHQRGLGAGLDRIAGDLVVGGAGDGVAVLVGRGLFLFQGIGGVALVVGLFLHAALGDIQQLGNILSGHFLRFGLAGLFQGQGLGVAVLGGLDLVHGVTAQLGILIGFPVRTHVLAKLVVEVDLFALLGVGDGSGGIGLAGAGGGRSLGAGGLGGGGDGGVAVLVLAHHGVALLHLGVGVHDGGAGRAVGGLFLGGLADLAVLAGGFVLLAVVDHVTLHIGAVGVLSLVRLAGLFRLLSRFIVNGDVIGFGAGAERGSLIIFLGLIVHRGNKLLLLSGFLLLFPFLSDGGGRGALGYRLGLRGSVILDRVGAFHSMGGHGLCSDTGGQGYGHGSEFQLFVRHD